jgi:EMG1/NEP1 methyltransferase
MLATIDVRAFGSDCGLACPLDMLIAHVHSTAVPVQKVFVHSKKNVLIDVHPQVRLPRTFRRFCGLFVQLLQKLSIRSTNSKERMLKARLYGASGARLFAWSANLPCTLELTVDWWAGCCMQYCLLEHANGPQVVNR